TLTEHWDGTSWLIVPSAMTNGTLYDELRAVTCASSSDCWAVGFYYNGSDDQTLIEHWDGISWSIVSSPNDGTTHLLGVTCASSSDCWAVGRYNNGSVIERWDGTSWSIVSPPNNGTSSDSLNGLTCTSSSNCWAVGYHHNRSGVAQTLVEHYGPVVPLNTVVSRKTHGDAGMFDINLPLTGTRGIECRAPGHLPGGAVGDYQMVFTFS